MAEGMMGVLYLFAEVGRCILRSSFHFMSQLLPFVWTTYFYGPLPLVIAPMTFAHTPVYYFPSHRQLK